jgi:autotransporter-associated beta strand protein
LINTGALAGSTDGLQGNITNNGTVIFDQGTNGSYAGMLSGTGAVNKAGEGNVTFTTENTYSGGTVINYGTLALNASSGKAAKNTASVTVSTGATLLISASEQVNDGASVTLSGGTITRGSGVSETFGSLNLTTSSSLDFSGGTAGTITFTGISYTPSALLSLNIGNFNQGSALVFQTTNNLSLTGFTFSGTGGFGGSTFDGDTFTITAIPEPSTYVAAVALLAVLMWPSRRRLVKDAKSIFGLRATARDRLAH